MVSLHCFKMSFSVLKVDEIIYKIKGKGNRGLLKASQSLQFSES